MQELTFIEESLAAVSPYVREMYAARDTVDVSHKRDANDFLTEVDLFVQQQLVARIRECFPDDWIVAEEEGLHRYPDDPNVRCWIIDPIDGTANFVRSLFPHFGVSLAFAEGNRPVAGGVAMPITNDVFLAAHGRGATRNSTPIRVSDFDSPELLRAEVDYGGSKDRVETVDRTSEFIKHIGQVRCHCAAVVGLCSVATGDLDVYVHMNLAPWDYAASRIILEEAGGIATRLDGSPLSLWEQRGGFLASNNVIHAELVSMLAEG
jgi:myo-inositol-1(or 4)-monophosphatase